MFAFHPQESQTYKIIWDVFTKARRQLNLQLPCNYSTYQQPFIKHACSDLALSSVSKTSFCHAFLKVKMIYSFFYCYLHLWLWQHIRTKFFFFFNWLLSYALLLPSLQGYSVLKLPLTRILPYLSIIIYASNWPLIVSVCFKTVLFHSNEKQESLMLPESRLCFKLNCKPWIELILGKMVIAPQVIESQKGSERF